MGYHRAGFDVVGVDIKDQPRYPFTFIRADVFALLDSPWFYNGDFAAIHASPPCPRFSDATVVSGNPDDHPDYIAPIRAFLRSWWGDYIIENVEGAPLLNPVTVCGTALGLGVDGYRLRRHRLFETSFPVEVPMCACGGDHRPVIDVSGGGPTHAPRKDGNGGRTYKGTVAQKKAAMGIDWMNGTEVVDAIPPAYTQLLAPQIPARNSDRPVLELVV
jgi:DNA (cytosine-5)-methyltransferase 1